MAPLPAVTPLQEFAALVRRTMESIRHGGDASFDGGAGHAGECRERFGSTLIFGAVRDLAT